MDSAYMSTDVSDPFSSGLEGVDEDHYGYVLPTERGSRSTVPHGRTSRNSKSAAKTDVQEYELMNKQPPRISTSPTDSTDGSSALCNPSSPASPYTCSILPQKRDTDSTQTEQSDNGTSLPEGDSVESAAAAACEYSLVGRETCTTDENKSESSPVEEEPPTEPQPQEAVVEYEYMDIRIEINQQNSPASSPGEVESDSREAIYQNVSARHKENEDSDLTTRHSEYVDMEASGRTGSEDRDQVDYQNFPVKGRPVVGEEPQKAGLRSYIKVCAGVEAQNTSFDNPDYWHSRLFHKQDAVCT